MAVLKLLDSFTETFAQLANLLAAEQQHGKQGDDDELGCAQAGETSR